MTLVGTSPNSAASAPPSNFRSGLAIGIAANAIFGLLGSPNPMYLASAAMISGISLMAAGLIHLKRAADRAAEGGNPAYWRGCLFVCLGAASVAVPAVHSMIGLSDVCGGDPSCIESFQR